MGELAPVEIGAAAAADRKYSTLLEGKKGFPSFLSFFRVRATIKFSLQSRVMDVARNSIWLLEDGLGGRWTEMEAVKIALHFLLPPSLEERSSKKA